MRPTVTAFLLAVWLGASMQVYDEVSETLDERDVNIFVVVALHVIAGPAQIGALLATRSRE